MGPRHLESFSENFKCGRRRNVRPDKKKRKSERETRRGEVVVGGERRRYRRGADIDGEKRPKMKSVAGEEEPLTPVGEEDEEEDERNIWSRSQRRSSARGEGAAAAGNEGSGKEEQTAEERDIAANDRQWKQRERERGRAERGRQGERNREKVCAAHSLPTVLH